MGWTGPADRWVGNGPGTVDTVVILVLPGPPFFFPTVPRFFVSRPFGLVLFLLFDLSCHTQSHLISYYLASTCLTTAHPLPSFLPASSFKKQTSSPAGHILESLGIYPHHPHRIFSGFVHGIPNSDTDTPARPLNPPRLPSSRSMRYDLPTSSYWRCCRSHSCSQSPSSGHGQGDEHSTCSSLHAAVVFRDLLATDSTYPFRGTNLKVQDPPTS